MAHLEDLFHVVEPSSKVYRTSSAVETHRLCAKEGCYRFSISLDLGGVHIDLTNITIIVNIYNVHKYKTNLHMMVAMTGNCEAMGQGTALIPNL